jgi:hypothetical protein
MTVKFTIISGKPSNEELAILTQVLNQHKRVEKDPVVKRSTWAQLNLAQDETFNAFNTCVSIPFS